MASTLDPGMSREFPITEMSVTYLTQVAARTLDAPRWCVIG